MVALEMRVRRHRLVFRVVSRLDSVRGLGLVVQGRPEEPLVEERALRLVHAVPVLEAALRVAGSLLVRGLRLEFRGLAGRFGAEGLTVFDFLLENIGFEV